MSTPFEIFYRQLVELANLGKIRDLFNMLNTPGKNPICRNNRILVKAFEDGETTLIDMLRSYHHGLKFELIDMDILYEVGQLNDKVVKTAMNLGRDGNLDLLRQSIIVGEYHSVSSLLSQISFVDFQSLPKSKSSQMTELINSFMNSV